MTIHTLKIWPAHHFEAVVSGRKTVELRKNDRDYQVGDTLILQEWSPLQENQGGYTGRQVSVTVTHKISDEQWLQPEVVALSIRGPRAEALERLYHVVRDPEVVDWEVVDKMIAELDPDKDYYAEMERMEAADAT